MTTFKTNTPKKRAPGTSSGNRQRTILSAVLGVILATVILTSWRDDIRYSKVTVSQPVAQPPHRSVLLTPVSAASVVARGEASTAIPRYAQGVVYRDVPVRPGQKVIALTFDDGPWPVYTRQMLSVLAENHVKATFFMVGRELTRRPEIGREVLDAGHAIGNHSWDHPMRPADPVGQVRMTDDAITKFLGIKTNLFRPPYGLLKNGMAGQARAEDKAIMLWNADCADWKKPGAAHIAMMICGQAHPGGIALMHDGGGNRSQTVAALPIIIHTLRARGYRFVTVPQLLSMRYIDPHAPKARAKAGRAKLHTASHMSRAIPHAAHASSA